MGLQGRSILVLRTLHNKTRQTFDSPKVETSNSSGWGQAALSLKPQNHGEAASEEGTKPPAEAWNTLELSFEAKFYLEEKSKCRQVLTGSVAPTLGWGSQASWLREESAKDCLPSFSRASAWLPLGPRTLRKLLDMFSPVYQNYSDYSLGSFGTSWLVETCIEVTKKMVLRNVGGSSSLRILGPRVQVFVQHCFRLWAGTSATRSGSSSSKDGTQETWEYPFVPYLGLWLACRERKLRGWAKKNFSWQPSAYFNWRSFQHRCDPKGKAAKARPNTSDNSRAQDAKCHGRMFKWRKEVKQENRQIDRHCQADFMTSVPCPSPNPCIVTVLVKSLCR